MIRPLDLVRLVRIGSRAAVVFLRPLWDRVWLPLFVVAWCYRRMFIRKTKIVSVIGSLGKTTTTLALQHMLVGQQRSVSYSNYGSSLAANLLACQPRSRWWVLEVGIAAPGHMGRPARMLRPDVVVVTSIKSDHHRSFGTLQGTRAEKVKMVRALRANGLAVLNGDDPHVRWMASQTNARVVYFGLNDQNDVRATAVEMDWPHGTRFMAHAAGQQRPMQMPLFGDHHVNVALAAIAVGLEAGSSLDTIAERIATVSPAKSRMEVIRLENGAFIVDDSRKAPLESFHACLDTFARIPASHRIAVLGDVDEPPGSAGDLYRDLGRRVAGVADLVVFVGSHDLQRVRTGAMHAGMDPLALVYAHASVEKAAALVAESLTPGSVVLIKGSQSRRLRRATLALTNRSVRCSARQCSAKVASCEECPIRDRDPAVFENAFIRRYVR